jgi:primosomal protein N'
MIFAQIILPIKLDWLPHYSLPYEVCNGTLVEVNLAGRLYVGVVHSTCPTPPQGLPVEKISPVVRILEDTPIVTPGQIRFWEEMAEYSIKLRKIKEFKKIFIFQSN